MTSILKQEDRLFLYRSEKPFPKAIRSKGYMGRPDEYYPDEKAIAKWFSSASRYPVSGSVQDATMKVWEFKMRELNFDFAKFERLLIEGVDVSGLKVEVGYDTAIGHGVSVPFAYLIEDTTEKETDIWDEILNECEEIIDIGGLRRSVVLREKLLRVAEKHGYKYEPHF